ncbi:MAG: primosomal protein N' [Oligoflexales bacterium]|nr:primosomal protein N' [Oligoflexales bacterium]
MASSYESEIVQLEVAIPVPVHNTFSYSYHDILRPGTRVLVPFNSRKIVGTVLFCGKEKGDQKRAYDLKSIFEVLDEEPVYSKVMLDLARWMSEYYFCPIGEVLRSMLPLGTKKIRHVSYALTEKGRERLNLIGPDLERDILGDLFKVKNSLSEASIRRKIDRIVSENDFNKENVLERYIKCGLINKKRMVENKAREVKSRKSIKFDLEKNQMLVLTEVQSNVLKNIIDLGLNAKCILKPLLLLGITGSGKTEIYLQAIAAVFERFADSQILMMVPEISLTPQMTRVFESRFPGMVSVVHSALTDTKRWGRLNDIRNGEKRILIGPRSSVFAPFKHLKLIIVDEEHDQSYKQNNGFAYNGRDIAVLRGGMEKACVVLGSATPSMESYQNALSGRYHLLELPERVLGRPLPKVDIINSDPSLYARRFIGNKKLSGAEKDSSVDLPISNKILDALEKNFNMGLQSIVIVNRRGYAYYLYSVDKKQAINCPYCSISLTVHSKSTLLRCHYCDYCVSLQKIVEERSNERFITVGYGSQQMEDFLKSRLPAANIVRVDSDSISKKDALTTALEQFSKGEIDILVGTQILAKGHDFPRVTLIVMIEVDQILNLPDFRSGERAFQLMVQASGRAGRAEVPGVVLVQTFRPDHFVIRSGVEQNFHEFATYELNFRRVNKYPPFSKLVAIEVSSENKSVLEEFMHGVDDWSRSFRKAFSSNGKIKLLGPSIPPIEYIRNRHRRSILILSENYKSLWGITKKFLDIFNTGISKDIRINVDVDPQSLL